MLNHNQVTVDKIFQIFRNGDNRTGVELLYQHYYRTMYGIAFTILKKEDICQDVVHNVICKLLLLDPSKFPCGHGLSWLYTVTKNEALMYLRNAPNLVSLEEMPAIIEEDKQIRDFVDMDSYEQMIRGLNDTQKQVVTLKVLGGCTHREIAKMLGKPVGTVQWIYHTSVNKLKKVLSVLFVLAVFTIIKFGEKIVNYIEIKKELPGNDLMATLSESKLEGAIIIYGLLGMIFSTLFWIIYKKYQQQLKVKTSK